MTFQTQDCWHQQEVPEDGREKEAREGFKGKGSKGKGSRHCWCFFVSQAIIQWYFGVQGQTDERNTRHHQEHPFKRHPSEAPKAGDLRLVRSACSPKILVPLVQLSVNPAQGDTESPNGSNTLNFGLPSIL